MEESDNFICITQGHWTMNSTETILGLYLFMTSLPFFCTVLFQCPPWKPSLLIVVAQHNVSSQDAEPRCEPRTFREATPHQKLSYSLNTSRAKFCTLCPTPQCLYLFFKILDMWRAGSILRRTPAAGQSGVRWTEPTASPSGAFPTVCR